MGHDIDIGNKASTSISFNWSRMSKFFHISDIHEHNNSDGRISKRLNEALSDLEKGGYTPWSSYEESPVDGWGQWKPDCSPELAPGVSVFFPKGFLALRKVLPMSHQNCRTIPRGAKGFDEKLVYRACIVGKENREFILKVDAHEPTDEPFWFRVPTDKLRKKCVISANFAGTPCYRMFALILKSFLELAEKFPGETWISDQCSTGRALYGVLPNKTLGV